MRAKRRCAQNRFRCVRTLPLAPALLKLARLFHYDIGTTPARYFEMVRVEAAQTLLQNGQTVATAARLSGFGSEETLRRVFVTRIGQSPTVYAEGLRAASAG